MDVFVVPVGGAAYELYCEPVDDDTPDVSAADERFVARLRRRFTTMVKAAEARQRGASDSAPPDGWMGRMQERTLAWVAERMAEQRLLWALRKVEAAVAVHPADLPYTETIDMIRRMLRQDRDRHRRWLVVHGALFLVSGILAIVPGPNVLAYYFAFRLVGHYLSMRGAAQGLGQVAWTGQACEPLSELRTALGEAPGIRDARIRDIAARLRLDHLPTFVERVAVRHA